MEANYMCHSGDDLLVVDAARASFGKASEWEYRAATKEEEAEAWAVGVVDLPLMKQLSQKDERLINYLAREKHVLPFRHPSITLRCKAPLFLARQLGKHQVGMSWSEESRRYIDSEPEFFWPDKWRKRAEDKKQGSTDEASEYMHDLKCGNEIWENLYEYVRDEVLGSAVNMYNGMIKNGVAPEQARMVLPQNMYINWVWTGTLLSWAHMYKLRTGHGAQKEAVEFAEMVREVIAPLYPVSWAALMEHYDA